MKLWNTVKSPVTSNVFTVHGKVYYNSTYCIRQNARHSDSDMWSRTAISIILKYNWSQPPAYNWSLITGARENSIEQMSEVGNIKTLSQPHDLIKASDISVSMSSSLMP